MRRRRPEGRPAERARGSRTADLLPVVTIVGGFALIALGWNGAASLDYTQGQIPYLISGGLAGMAAVFYGSAALVVRAIKKGQARQHAELEELNRTLQRLSAVLSWNGNGHARREALVEQAPDLVVAGPSSFHRSGCRMVRGREELLVRIPKAEAERQGLSPCRVCAP